MRKGLRCWPLLRRMRGWLVGEEKAPKRFLVNRLGALVVTWCRGWEVPDRAGNDFEANRMKMSE